MHDPVGVSRMDATNNSRYLLQSVVQHRPPHTINDRDLNDFFMPALFVWLSLNKSLFGPSLGTRWAHTVLPEI